MNTNFYQQLCEQEDKLTKKLDAIRVLKANYLEEEKALSSLKMEQSVTVEEYPTNYDKELSLKQKVYVALHRIHKGYANDIALSLHQLDSDFSLDRAKKVCTGLASALLKSKVIGAEKYGNKYKYFIKI